MITHTPMGMLMRPTMTTEAIMSTGLITSTKRTMTMGTTTATRTAWEATITCRSTSAWPLPSAWR